MLTGFYIVALFLIYFQSQVFPQRYTYSSRQSHMSRNEQCTPACAPVINHHTVSIFQIPNSKTEGNLPRAVNLALLCRFTYVVKPNHFCDVILSRDKLLESTEIVVIVDFVVRSHPPWQYDNNMGVYTQSCAVKVLYLTSD